MLVLINAHIYTVTGGEIPNGDILIKDGKIAAIGRFDIPEGCEIMDCTGKIVTPGLIDAHTHMSVFGEPSSLPGLSDGNEITSPITSHIRAYDAFNPMDISIAKVRGAGFTSCCTLPGSANLIGGTGFAFKLHEAATVDQMAIPGTECMKMALGENPRRCYTERNVIPTTRMGNGAVLREALYNACRYAEDKEKGKDVHDFKLESLIPVVKGQMQVRIHAHRADDIATACHIGEEFGLKFSVEHCTEGYMIPEFLGKRNISVVIGPLLMPLSKQELWNSTVKNAAELCKVHSLNVCLTADTGSATCYLPMQIGVCIKKGGLKFEDALKGVTINAAKLLHIDDRTGSLEVGKDADIAVFDGNPFSNFTDCVATFIDGKRY